jgi:hypothetical protein
VSGTNNEDEYDLIDLETGLVVGRISPTGTLSSASADVAERLARAFRQELMVKDGEVVEELGVCFADVTLLRPGEPEHATTVMRNLGKLAGVFPQIRDARPE